MNEIHSLTHGIDCHNATTRHDRPTDCACLSAHVPVLEYVPGKLLFDPRVGRNRFVIIRRHVRTLSTHSWTHTIVPVVELRRGRSYSSHTVSSKYETHSSSIYFRLCLLARVCACLFVCACQPSRVRRAWRVEVRLPGACSSDEC